MKRQRQEEDDDTSNKRSRTISPKELRKWVKDFNQNPINVLVRNSVVTVGSMSASTDSNEARNVNHIFINSLKKHNLKATNQGYSGRCWMFAGLNMFRHIVIKALSLENFEFSETYLYFYDKLERSNYFLQWFIDHSKLDTSSREMEYMLRDYMSDGGYWDMFANLIEKYGVIPKDAMPETQQSQFSEDMNAVIMDRITTCAAFLHKNARRMSQKRLQDIKKKTVKQVHDILVKYLGEPPKKFTWFFTTDDYSSQAVRSDPKEFTSLIFPNDDIRNFVVLSHFPTNRCKFYQTYQVRWTSNMACGKNATFLNLPIQELKKYTKSSVLSGMPVWFAGDVSKGFNWNHSSLNNKVNNNDLLFGEPRPIKLNKGERIDFHNTEANHAMVFTGVNLDEKDLPIEWQVENSWGYWDHEERGLDGFLSMSDEWFDQNVLMVVINKNFLSRSLQGKVRLKPIIIEPWDSMAPAIKVKPMNVPPNYLKILSNI